MLFFQGSVYVFNFLSSALRQLRVCRRKVLSTTESLIENDLISVQQQQQQLGGRGETNSLERNMKTTCTYGESWTNIETTNTQWRRMWTRRKKKILADKLTQSSFISPFSSTQLLCLLSYKLVFMSKLLLGRVSSSSRGWREMAEKREKEEKKFRTLHGCRFSSISPLEANRKMNYPRWINFPFPCRFFPTRPAVLQGRRRRTWNLR